MRFCPLIWRIIEANDGLVLSLAGRQLLCLDVPGHARHHIAIVDEKSGQIFTGDTFGVTYAELNGPQQQFVFPTNNPVQFEPEALHASMDRLMSYRPAAVYPPHFGQLVHVERNGAALHRHLEAFVRIAREATMSGEVRHRQIHARTFSLCAARGACRRYGSQKHGSSSYWETIWSECPRFGVSGSTVRLFQRDSVTPRLPR